MQKTAKKFLSMLLALMMVLSILPTAVFATEQGTVAAPLDSIVPYGANDQTTGTATISVQNSVTFTGYSAFENVPYYLVTVPAGTTYVKATYKDAAILTNATSGVASGYYADVPQWTGGGVEMAYTESGGDITITIPLNYSRTAEDGTTVQRALCWVQMVAELPMRRSMTAAPAMRPSISSPSPMKASRHLRSLPVQLPQLM